MFSMDHESSISTIMHWIERRGYYIEMVRNGDDAVDRESKIMSINSSRSLETQLHIMLHECGHILVYENDSIVNGAEEVLTKYSDNSKIFKIFTVIEEIEAWKRGLSLAKRLGIPINKKKWNKDVARAIGSYMEWALMVGKFEPQ